jgi:hypothetical protein
MLKICSDKQLSIQQVKNTSQGLFYYKWRTLLSRATNGILKNLKKLTWNLWYFLLDDLTRQSFIDTLYIIITYTYHNYSIIFLSRKLISVLVIKLNFRRVNN